MGRRPRDEAGVLCAFVAVLAVALLAIAGLAVDTGRAVAAQRLASQEAEQAARTGADQLSVDALREGGITIDGDLAIQKAEQYTLFSGHPGTAWVRDGVVTVRVIVAVPTTVLGIVRVNTITVSATASATDVAGVTRQD